MKKPGKSLLNPHHPLCLDSLSYLYLTVVPSFAASLEDPRPERGKEARPLRPLRSAALASRDLVLRVLHIFDTMLTDDVSAPPSWASPTRSTSPYTWIRVHRLHASRRESRGIATFTGGDATPMGMLMHVRARRSTRDTRRAPACLCGSLQE